VLAYNKLAYYNQSMIDDTLEINLGFTLADISRLMRKRFDESARDLELTRAQWRVLNYLVRYEGITQSSLADMLEIESITLGRHIDRLEEAGWVERRHDPSDRRVWLLFLQDKARPILDRLGDIANETLEEALSGLSKKQRLALMDKLLLIKGNLVNKENGDRKTGIVYVHSIGLNQHGEVVQSGEHVLMMKKRPRDA